MNYPGYGRCSQTERQQLEGKSAQYHTDLLNPGPQKLPKLLLIFRA
jgi:hypothetical protein